jgi:RNA-directed DNA polymerase
MKRFRDLWPQITSFENLLFASRKAQKSKRFRDNVLGFNANLEAELFQLQHELLTHTYQPGKYRTFEIFEPKPRIIAAAPYRDRVVHHALCNVIVPLFDRLFIFDSYANRTGKGTHKALRRFTQFCGRYEYILQCDVRKYFPSIDHAMLKALIRAKLKCPETLWLIDLIIDNGILPHYTIDYLPGDDLLAPLRPHGLPIGNLTSQFFANIYLNQFDHYVTETLEVPAYLRYVDDFICFGDDRAFLAEVRQAIEAYLATQLRLTIHPIKSQLFALAQGASFVGFRVIPHGTAFPKKIQIRVRNDNLRRGRKRLRQMQTAIAQGEMTIGQMERSIGSWLAHLQHGDTWRLRTHIMIPLTPLKRGNQIQSPPF